MTIVRNSPQVIYTQFTSILAKLKYKNHHVTTPSSLHRVVAIVATVGSYHIWDQEKVDEVISRPAAVMLA
jgi:hypothetical protein